MNLLEGYDDYEDKFLGQDGCLLFNELLKWIIATNYKLDDKQINFVARRGSLCKIATTAHRRNIISSDKKSKMSERGHGLKCSYAGTVFAGSRVIKEDGVFPYLVAECRLKGIKCLVTGEPDCQDQDDRSKNHHSC